MDQLTAIRAFLRIVETGSVTRAALSLGLPKSTTSKLLADLEHHLGARLLQRSTRSLSLTAEGAEYYEQAGQIVQRLADTDLAIRDQGAAASGRIRIDVSSAIAQMLLIPALPQFRARYPGIELVIGVSDRPVKLIEEAVDCAIRLGDQADTSMISRVLYTDRAITCASPEYLARRGSPLSPAELKDHDTVGYVSALTGEAWPMRFERQGEVIEITRHAILSNDSASCLTLIRRGFGVGQAFGSVIRNDLHNGSLVPVLEGWTTSTAPISVLFAHRQKPGARVRVFIDWLTEAMKLQASL